MSDDKKVNKWAKVLSDAGLLDDVDDSWELPTGGVSEGATIEVTGSEDAIGDAPSSTLTPPMESHERVTIEETVPPREGEETTARVDYEDAVTSGPVGRASRMPLSPVRKSEEPERSAEPFGEPPIKKDTDPAPMARYSMAGPAAEGVQPEFVDSKVSYPPDPFADNGPITVAPDPFADVRAATGPPAPPADEETLSGMGSREVPQDERITVPPAAREDDTARVALATPPVEQPPAERPLEPEGERKVRVGDAQISIAPYKDEVEAAGGSIVDEPIPGQDRVSLTPEKPDLRAEMARKYDLADFSGALEIAEEILAAEPDSLDAIQYKKSCQERLLKMYESRIGDMENTPQIQVSNHELMWRNLDASAGFVLSRVDGISTYENILDISGMPRFETCRILHQLISDGLITHD